MKRTVLLLASVTLVVLLGCGAALAVVFRGPAAADLEASAASAKGPDAALDRALKKLVCMEGGPPGVIAVVQRGRDREVHTFGVANLENKRRMKVGDRMRIASTSKAFSGAVALSLALTS